MGSFKALTMAGVVALGAIGPAAAADLLPPAPHIEVLPPAPDFSGWYLRADVGVGVNQISSLRSTLDPQNLLGGAPPATTIMHKSIGDSAIISAGVGYQFNNWFRADVTGEYRSQASYRAGIGYAGSYTPAGYPSNPTAPLNYCGGLYCLDNYTSNIGSAVFLANGYVDLGTWAGVTPYIGAGIGTATHKWTALTDVGAGSGLALDRTQTNFAWAVMAGLGYSITPNLKLEMGYRYLNMGTLNSNSISCGDINSCFFERHSFNLASNDFRIGFRYLLGDAGPVPVLASPPGPLVRKY